MRTNFVEQNCNWIQNAQIHWNQVYADRIEQRIAKAIEGNFSTSFIGQIAGRLGIDSHRFHTFIPREFSARFIYRPTIAFMSAIQNFQVEVLKQIFSVIENFCFLLLNVLMASFSNRFSLEDAGICLKKMNDHGCLLVQTVVCSLIYILFDTDQMIRKPHTETSYFQTIEPFYKPVLRLCLSRDVDLYRQTLIIK